MANESENTLKHFDHFTKVLLNDMKPIIQKEFKRLSLKEEFLRKLFESYMEISESYNYINDIEQIIGLYPYRQQQISKNKLLKYHLISYLHETNILRDRLIRFITKIERGFKKDPLASKIAGKKKLMVENIEESFKNIKNHRDKHVHEARYIDMEFNDIEGIELIVNAGKDDNEKDHYRQIYNTLYKELKDKLKRQIKQNNIHTRSIIDNCFDGISILIVDKDRIVFPKDISGT